MNWFWSKNLKKAGIFQKGVNIKKYKYILKRFKYKNKKKNTGSVFNVSYKLFVNLSLRYVYQDVYGSKRFASVCKCTFGSSKCLDLKNLDLIRGILTAAFEVYRVFFPCYKVQPLLSMSHLPWPFMFLLTPIKKKRNKRFITLDRIFPLSFLMIIQFIFNISTSSFKKKKNVSLKKCQKLLFILQRKEQCFVRYCCFHSWNLQLIIIYKINTFIKWWTGLTDKHCFRWLCPNGFIIN